jgi:hypothetical protein
MRQLDLFNYMAVGVFLTALGVALGTSTAPEGVFIPAQSGESQIQTAVLAGLEPGAPPAILANPASSGAERPKNVGATICRLAADEFRKSLVVYRDCRKTLEPVGELVQAKCAGVWEHVQDLANSFGGQGRRGATFWYDDYARATAAAQRQGKMLFIYFCDPGGACDCNRFKSETLEDDLVRAKLRDYVCVELPLDASITEGGEQIVLLKHGAFKEMLGDPGIAIVDYMHDDPQLYGAVVSTFPITRRLWYTPEKMAAILDLPAGTLTQRTLIYAVLTHPDKPASAKGEASPYLFEEAQKQSQYQADVRVQGHHFWESRFHRISARLNGLSAREVCAESWPGENLVEAAVECVRCWRSSAGHWSAVSGRQRVFGYDMKRGANGVWYATGIFGG